LKENSQVLEETKNSVIKKVNSKDITNITLVDAGLAFRYDEEE